MAIRFVEREPARDTETEGAVSDVPPAAAVTPAAETKRARRRRKAAASPVEVRSAPVAAAEANREDPAPVAPEPTTDGLLPGLVETPRPRERRRGRMMGFG